MSSLKRYSVLYTLFLCITSIGVAFYALDSNAEAFIDNSIPELTLTTAERAWLDAHPVIRMGIDKQFAPYEWLDENERYLGIAADYIKLLEHRLNVRFKPVKDKDTWMDVLEAARKGEIDMVSCLVKTPERSTYLQFSKPYLSSVAVIIGEQSRGYIDSLDRLAGKTVAIHKGHFTDELLRADHPDIRIVNTGSLQQALQWVANGRADAFVGDATAAGYAMKREGLLNLSFVGQTEYQSEFRIGVLHHHAELNSIINKALDSITQAEYNAIYDRWHGLQTPIGIPREKLFIYGSAGLFLILSFAYWNYRLRVSEKAHRASEDAYRRSEKRFKNLVDTTNGIVWEADAQSFELTFISDNVERILGYSSTEFKQPGFWQEHIFEADREKAVQFCLEQTALKRNHNFEYRFITKSGDIVWLKDLVSVVTEQTEPRWLRGIMLDITEIKKADLLIQQSEQRFRELIESLPTIAVWGYDENRNIIYWNDASTALYGYTRKEVLGHKLEDLIIPNDLRHKAIQHHKNWLRNGVAIPAEEQKLRHKNGQLIPVFSCHIMLDNYTSGKELFSIDISLVEQKRITKELTYLANYDSLTQLPNRRTFLDRLRQHVKKAKRNGTQVALILLDLDHFKEVNDTLGHDIGDLLLQEAAHRLKKCIRNTDTVARLGGDEFTIILSDLKENGAIERISEDVLQKMVAPFFLNKETIYISCSIGITIYPLDSSDIDMLLKNADQAMYAAKATGRNRFCYFTASMEAAAQERRRLNNDLRIALKLKQFQILYQPIIEMKNGKVFKAEALIRWRHPERGLVSPDKFIPIAEDSGVIIELGNWIFDQAILQTLKWRKFYHTDFQVSVNISPVQLRSIECFQEEWFAKLNKTGLTGHGITVEITEGILMESSPAVHGKLLSFRDAFVEVALDDFGTGYSSLSYLKRFDIDYLKIDRSFVSNLTEASHDMVLCEAIIVMAHKLGIKVIAEGVETKEQYELLAAAGCDFGQGYLFSPPVTAEEFDRLLDGRLCSNNQTVENPTCIG